MNNTYAECLARLQATYKQPPAPVEQPSNSAEQMLCQLQQRRSETNCLLQTWADLIPLEPPTTYQLNLWTRVYGFAAALYGLEAVAKTFNRRVNTEDEMTFDEVVRYASGCMRNYVQQREAK